MKLTINYFGMIAESTGAEKAEFEFAGNTVSEFRRALENAFKELGGMSYQVAVNQKLVPDDTELNERDEIAVLPPFAGG